MDSTLQPLSPVQQLRLASHAQWLEQLKAKLNNFLLPSCAIYLFGSRARGDWDGYSDTDLLVVCCSQEMAEIQADKLRDGLVGDDVIAVSAAYWQAIGSESSLHWQAIKRYAQLLAGKNQ